MSFFLSASVLTPRPSSSTRLGFQVLRQYPSLFLSFAPTHARPRPPPSPPPLSRSGLPSALLSSLTLLLPVCSFDKITARISKLCYGLDPTFVEPIE